MKKLVAILTTSFLLTGCGMYTMEEETEDQTEETENQAQAEEDQAEIEFSLQESDRQAQVSPFNDESLKLLSDRVYSEEEAVGEEGKVTVDYSGSYLNTDDALYGVFLITNRTNTPMTNISMNVSMTNGDEALLNNHPVFLAQDHFGVLEADTAMPLYIRFDTEQEQALNGANSLEDVEVKLDKIDYKEPGQVENPSAQKEGYQPGYHPSYTEAVVSQQELNENIATGNVPQLELLNPPIFQDQTGQEIIENFSEETLNSARGLAPEGETSLFWTGITQQAPEGGDYQTVFLLANRTGTGYSNAELDLSFGKTDGQQFIDGQTTTLSEEDYGQLTDKSLMPIYVSIPSENAEAFSEYLQSESGGQAVYEIENFSGEESES